MIYDMLEESVKERLVKFIKGSGISVNAFERKAGLSVGYMRQLRCEPSPTKLKNILDAFPQLNDQWLLTGEGGMLRTAPDDMSTPIKSLTDGVPYYDVDFLLGFNEIDGPGAANPEYLIRMPGYDKATLWCNASGHSMEPEINNGDIIALQRIEDFSFLPFGDLYGFITTNGMRTIKRLGRSLQPGHYRLIPTNRDYDEQDIPISAIACVYRVMGAMKAF